ncbi:sugar transferase [uncultured Desulfobacter sp.]|uniref:sugar transferase n=1 Tax=uncultured Desulfobacter sp. TaxID=240139 RepID=UPI0029F46962|nr:sugar transferase [uncultured Desulfobacter sp.]
MKDIFDRSISIMALLILSPLIISLAALIQTKLGAPVFFKQIRPGRHGKLFTLYKFRTMTDAKDKKGRLLSDAKRLTPFGKFLRSTSLDELPELFNVAIGDMSLVGPRPLLIQYLDRYTKEQDRRHDVKPGLTGWAQINGRNELSWDEKFEFDTWYVDHQSFILDLKILILTIGTVMKRKGVTAKGEATAKEFFPK